MVLRASLLASAAIAPFAARPFLPGGPALIQISDWNRNPEPRYWRMLPPFECWEGGGL